MEELTNKERGQRKKNPEREKEGTCKAGSVSEKNRQLKGIDSKPDV